MRAGGSLRQALGLLALAQHAAATRCPQALKWDLGLCNMDGIREEYPLVADCTFSSDETPLHWAFDSSTRSACSCSNSACAIQKEMVQFMLYSNPDVNAQSSNGNSPLHQAMLLSVHSEVSEAAIVDIIALLLQAGADPNLDNNAGSSPLVRHNDTRMTNHLGFLFCF